MNFSAENLKLSQLLRFFMILSELLRHLEDKSCAVINIEVAHQAFFSFESLQILPDQTVHHGHFCVRMKYSGGMRVCAKNKERSKKVASKGRAFSGCCPWGVWELAMPLVIDGQTACIIYLGHFRSETVPLKSVEGAYSGKDLPLVTAEKKKELMHHALFIRDFISLEIERWLKSGGVMKKQKSDAYYLESCMSYISCRYNENIAVSDLADSLGVNPNYLSGLIRKKSGSTFRELLTAKRVEEAKIFLKFNPSMSIAEIAVQCGFSDSNYFCTVFRKETGQSPRSFRKG